MKILNVIESLGRGGAEQALVNLLPTLCNRGIKCEVAVLWSPHSLVTDLEKQGISVHCLNIRHRWSILAALSKITKLLHKGHFDIVHAHLFFAGFYTALTHPLAPLPSRIVSFHNLGYESYPASNLWKRFRKQVDRWLTQTWIDGHIAVSQAVAHSYSTHLELPYLEVIHNAFPLNALQSNLTLNRQQVRATYQANLDDFIIIVPGRLVPEKGHRFLFQAIQILQKNKLFPKLLVFGDGPLQNELHQQITTARLERQVLLHPAIPHQELMQILQCSDIFVMASLFEGFGLAPAEAMALERPVICSQVGGLTDLIENGVSGILVPPANPEALAEAIAKLIVNPTLREQLGKAGRKRIETCFNVEVIADRYVQYYQKILENKKN